MSVLWKTAHLAAFSAAAAVVLLTFDRIVQPAMTGSLLLVLGLGLVAALPGYLHSRALPLSLLLAPAGLYLLVRLLLPLPEDIATRADEAAFYLDELRSGLRAYAEDVFPLTLGAVSGFELLMAVWAYLLVTMGLLLGLGARSPVLGTGVLVGVLGFTTTVDPDPSVVPTLLFLACVLLALATSPDGRRRVWRLRDALGGVGTGALAVGLALVLLAGFPGLVRPGWTNWRSFDPFGDGASTVFVFNWKQNYPRLLESDDPVPVLRVTSRAPSYWRATTLEFFTGNAWLGSEPFLGQLSPGPGARDLTRADPEPPGSVVQQRFELMGTATNYVFTGGYVRSVTLDSVGDIFVSNAGALRTGTILMSPAEYEMTVLVPRVSPEQLMGTTFDYPESIRDIDLDLPFPDVATFRESNPGGAPPSEEQLSAWGGADFAQIYDLSDRIVGDADDPYEVTLRIERYLRTNYTYSLEVPDSAFVSPIAAFLFDHKKGYCQHFAGAMALLLRLNGVPARVAVGFTTGEEVGTWTYVVRSNNAHAWVEAYFAGVGWLPFDATPGRPLPVAGPSSASPGFVDPFIARDSPTGPPDPTGLPGGQDRLPQDVETGGDSATTPGRVPWGLILSVILIAAVVGGPFLGRRMRSRQVRRRAPEDRLLASIRLLRGDLVVAGVPVAPSSTLDEVAALADERLSFDLSPLARRTQEITFGGRTASPDDVLQAEQARAQVVRLGWRRRRVATLSTWYGVAPALDWWRRRMHPDARPPLPARRGPTWRLG